MVRSVEDIVKIPGGGSKAVVDWVFTPITAALEASINTAVAATVAAGSTAGRYDATPTAGMVPYTSIFYSAIEAAGDIGVGSGTRWMDFITPAGTGSDTIAYIIVLFRPADLSIAAAVDATFSSPPPSTYNGLVYQYITSNGAMTGGVVTGGAVDNNTSTGVTVTAGDRVQLGWNQTTGETFIAVNGGTPVLLTTAPEAVRAEKLIPTVLLFSTAATPVFSGGPLDVTFNSAETGFPGYQKEVAPALPDGTKDGDRYKITTSGGTLFGKTVRQGDIIEVISEGTDIIVTTGQPPLVGDALTAAIAAGVGTELGNYDLPTVISNFEKTRVIAKISPTPPSSGVADGEGVVVPNSPSGDWLAVTPGVVMIKNGAEWVEYTPKDGMEFDVLGASNKYVRWVYVTDASLASYAGLSTAHPAYGGDASNSGDLLNWLIINKYPFPKKARRETLTDGQELVINAEHPGGRFVNALVSGTVTANIGGNFNYESVGWVMFRTAGAPAIVEFTKSGAVSYSGFRERIPYNGKYPGRIRLKAYDYVVVQWTEVSDDAIDFAIVGGSTDNEMIPKGLSLVEGGTVSIDAAYHVVEIVEGDDIAAGTIEVPIDHFTGSPMLIRFGRGVEQLTWSNTSGISPGQDTQMVNLPTTINSGDTYLLWRIGGWWRAELIGDSGQNRRTKLEPNIAYTFTSGDEKKILRHSNAGAVAVSVPTNATTPFPIGTILKGWQDGAGAVTLGGSVTFKSEGNKLTTAGQYAHYELEKVDTDTWLVRGNLVV